MGLLFKEPDQIQVPYLACDVDIIDYWGIWGRGTRSMLCNI